MRVALLLVLAGAFTVAADEPKDDKLKEAAEETRGHLVVESAVDSGEGIGSELNWEWVFDGNKMTRQNPNGAKRKRSPSRSIPPFLRRRST